MNRGKKFGFVFILLGGALAWLGFDASSILWKIICFSCALASASLGTAYVLNWPGLLGKKRTGALLASSYLLFWPYHLLSYASLAMFRLMRVVPFQELVPGLFLGGRLLSWEQRKSAPLANASVLDLTSEFCEVGFFRMKHPYLCIPLLDGTAPNKDELRAGVDFITEQLRARPVYIHCAMGHGRGATFAIAWLVASGRMRNIEEALSYVRSKRPGVKIREGQMRAIREFADERRNL